MMKTNLFVVLGAVMLALSVMACGLSTTNATTPTSEPKLIDKVGGEISTVCTDASKDVLDNPTTDQVLQCVAVLTSYINKYNKWPGPSSGVTSDGYIIASEILRNWRSPSYYGADLDVKKIEYRMCLGRHAIQDAHLQASPFDTYDIVCVQP